MVQKAEQLLKCIVEEYEARAQWQAEIASSLGIMQEEVSAILISQGYFRGRKTGKPKTSLQSLLGYSWFCNAVNRAVI